MRGKRLWIIAVAALWFGAVPGGWAGEVVLVNGDVLHGAVRREGETVVLDHPVLGLLTFPKGAYVTVTEDASRAGAAESTSGVEEGARAAPQTAAAGATGQARPWTFGLGVGLSLDKGNTDEFKVHADIQGDYKWGGRHSVDGRFNMHYGETQGVRDEENVDGLLRYRRELTPGGRAFIASVYKRDDFAGPPVLDRLVHRLRTRSREHERHQAARRRRGWGRLRAASRRRRHRATGLLHWL